MFIIYFLLIVLGVVLIYNRSEKHDLPLRGLGAIIMFIGTILSFSLLIPDIECSGVRKYISNPEQFEVDTIKHSTGIIEYKVTYKE